MSKRKRKGDTPSLAKSWASDPNLSEALELEGQLESRAADLQRAAEELLRSGDVARRIESRERLRGIIDSLVVMVPVEVKKLRVSVGTQSEPLACSSLGTQTKQVMQPVKSVNYVSVVKRNIRDVPDGRQSRGAQNSVVPVPNPRRFIAGAPQIDRTRVQNESFVPVKRRKKVLRGNVLERIRTSKSVILRPKEGETLLELRKSFLEMLKSVEASPEKSPKISAIKSNEAKNFLVVDLLNEVEQRKVENLIKSKLVFSRPTGFDPAVSVHNVPSDLTEGEILEALVAKNGLLFASGEKERSKVRRRFRNSRGNCDVVVRMAPATHRQLGEKKDKRVFLLFSAHPYKNGVQTLRCFKCFGYGHTDAKGASFYCYAALRYVTNVVISILLIQY